MTRDDDAVTGVRAGPVAATTVGVAIGVVQTVIWIGYLRSATPALAGADRGFGDWNIRAEGAWLAAYLVVSVVLVAATLAAAKLPHVALLTAVLLGLETVVAAYTASILPWDGNATSFVLVPTLAVLLMLTQRLARRGDRNP